MRNLRVRDPVRLRGERGGEGCLGASGGHDAVLVGLGYRVCGCAGVRVCGDVKICEGV